MKSRTAFAVALFASAVSVRVFAQPSGVPSAPQPPKEMPEYGTTGTSSVRIPAWDFSRMDGGPLGVGAGISRFPADSALPFLVSSVHVPGGTRITRVELDYCDTSTGDHLVMSLLECDNQGQNCTNLINLESTANGCSFVADNSLNHRIDNYHHLYVLDAGFGEVDGTVQLASVILSYQLDVSPAPGTPTFGDVPPSDPAFQFIEALVASSITAGCAGGNYCPDAPLTRRQMAVFLAKALGLQWTNF